MVKKRDLPKKRKDPFYTLQMKVNKLRVRGYGWVLTIFFAFVVVFLAYEIMPKYTGLAVCGTTGVTTSASTPISIAVGSTTTVGCTISFDSEICTPPLNWQNGTSTFTTIPTDNPIVDCNGASCSETAPDSDIEVTRTIRCGSPITNYQFRCSGDTFSSAYLNLTCTSEATAPVTTLVSPSNALSNTSTSHSFKCNATDNAQLINITLYHNISGSFVANQTQRVLNTQKLALAGTFQVANIQPGNYLWNCLSTDSSNNKAWASSNNTFTVTSPAYVINASIINHPSNITYNGSTSIPLNFTKNGTASSHFYSLDFTSNTTITNNITFNVTSEGSHTLTLYANDSVNTINSSSIIFTVNTSINVSLVFPPTGYETTNPNLTFTFNVTSPDPIGNCTVYIEHTPNTTITGINKGMNLTINVSSFSVDNTYGWRVQCEAPTKAENSSVFTQRRLFDVGSQEAGTSLSVGDSGGSGGGGGGGGGSTTSSSLQRSPSTISSSNEAQIFNDMKRDDKIELSVELNNANTNEVSTEIHNIEITNVHKDSIFITISSKTQTFLMKIGEIIFVDLNEDSYPDISIKLNSIDKNEKVSLTVTPLSKKPEETSTQPSQDLQETDINNILNTIQQTAVFRSANNPLYLPNLIIIFLILVSLTMLIQRSIKLYKVYRKK